MSTIAFIMLPELGHLNPSFKIARALLNNGHRVIYLSTEDCDAYIRSRGFESFPIFEKLLPKGFLSNSFIDSLEKGWLESPNAFKHLISDQGRLISVGKEELMALIERMHPDLLVVDTFLPIVSLLASDVGIQSISLNCSFNIYDHFFQGLLSPIKRIPELVLCPQELDLPQTRRSERPRFYIEPSIYLDGEPQPFPWHELSADQPLIYCTLGSQSHIYGELAIRFFYTLIEAIGEMENWQLVLTTGAALDPDDVTYKPKNVLLVRHTPQLEILKRTSIMITHGGLGSIKECIFFGVPMIVFPLRRDQPRNAARVVYHGLGMRADITRVSVEMIHNVIESVDKNPAFKTNVEAMRQRFRKIEESERGSRIIEKVLETLERRATKQVV